MKKSGQMKDRVRARLEEIYSEEDFVTSILSSLKNDYECEHLLRLIGRYNVQTPDNVLIMAVIISNAGAAAKHKGDYLKEIDGEIENALLEESAESGEDAENDDTRNLEELLDKSEAGDAEAMFYAACSIAMSDLEEGELRNELMRLRFSYLKKLVKTKGYETTLIMMGDAYANGDGVPQDGEEAIRWYKKAVKKGMAFGNECIGLLYFDGKGVDTDYKKAFKYFTKDRGKKSFCTLYSLGEMYRQGLYVEKDADMAWRYYQEILDNDGPADTIDDYYWRACYRMGMELYAAAESEATRSAALRMVTAAKELYDNRGTNAAAADITKEELYEHWEMLDREVRAARKMLGEMPVIRKVRCITEDEPDLTKDKVYEVLTEEKGLYGVIDDEGGDIYLYSPQCFETVDE